MVEIQSYLRDEERAGSYFVDGGMYATLSLRMFKVIFASDTFQCNSQRNYDGGNKDSNNEMPEDDDGEFPIPPTDADTLKLAISTLSFYLSNSDYHPKLAIYSRSLLSQTGGENHMDNLRTEITLLCETIYQYLKKTDVTSTSLQEQFQTPTPENQAIDSVRRTKPTTAQDNFNAE
ncbi:hypothetical protein M413DRAFT_31081 [Hebeloma cylindrosporum]|uniref:Uncharacterized protein n=1 Tax=Hebeloma cylindrosporum TaxID=76867 RepID=A0A0C3BKB4_HEBCY|nr:hypothetical protein M413DRAFT_31081 [Hebeloma cylindrosporum h7]